MFKKGDIVRCINASLSEHITQDTVYEVKSEQNENYVKIICDHGGVIGYDVERFELSGNSRQFDTVRRYKKGDRVTCLHTPRFRGITKHDTYEVVEDESDDENQGVRIEDDENMHRRYSRSYFILDKEAEPKLARPFKVGDKVSFGGLEGEVVRIDSGMTSYPVVACLNGNKEEILFTMYGMFAILHTIPLLILVEPVKMVTVTMPETQAKELGLDYLIKQLQREKM